jgi:hypothetical protein
MHGPLLPCTARQCLQLGHVQKQRAYVLQLMQLGHVGQGRSYRSRARVADEVALEAMKI